jgi:hypothetical protein
MCYLKPLLAPSSTPRIIVLIDNLTPLFRCRFADQLLREKKLALAEDIDSAPLPMAQVPTLLPAMCTVGPFPSSRILI